MDVKEESAEQKGLTSLCLIEGYGQLMAEGPLSPPASWFYKFLNQEVGFLCKLWGW